VKNGGTRADDQLGVYSQCLALHGLMAEVVAPRDPFARLLSFVLAGYSAADSPDRADFRVGISPSQQPDRWDVTVGDRWYGDLDPADETARTAEWGLANEVIRRLPGFLHVHAAVVATPEQSVLLVGPAGSGKSTISVAMAQAGFILYSDDVALISRETLRPLSFPRPIKLDDPSRALLGQMGLVVPREVRLGDSVMRTALPAMPPPNAIGPPVKTVFFFAAKRRVRPQVRALTTAEALLLLIGRSSAESITLTGPTVGGTALVNAARCYELVAGRLADTVRTVIDLSGAG
jgi:hypothetical protein